MHSKKAMLLLVSGFGINDNEQGNAIKLAKLPNYEKMIRTCPTSKLKTSGKDVGLPENQIGDTISAKLNIKAGRVVRQNLLKINKSIDDGNFFSISEFEGAIDNCKKNNSKLHLIGLVSNGGIHSHTRHLYALLELAKRKDFSNVFIHAITDGRDTPQTSGEFYISDLDKKIKEKGIGKIATIAGRHYAMDRAKNWDRVEKYYNAIVNGIGEKTASATTVMEKAYQKEIFDEFLKPTIVYSNNKPVATIENGDSIIFFNYREDRLLELEDALLNKEFDKFETKKDLNLYITLMAGKGSDKVRVAFKNETIKNDLFDYIEKNDIKYKEAKSIDEAVSLINSSEYSFIVEEYKEIDHMGHLGTLEDAIRKAEEFDKEIARLIEAAEKNKFILVITSDHGNIEEMIDYKTGEANTSHTKNDVPFIIVGKDGVKLNDGKLADIAPTILELMELEKPIEMTGVSLIAKN